MSEVYKKFTAQDYAVVPFNAHKQYNITSASSEENRLTWHNVKWTSESVSLYSSESSYYGGDTINFVKYNQIDHLFYKNFKKEVFNRFGYNNYLKQQRKLYENAQILSIPSGLYGHEIKPGNLYISSSNYEILDDSYGNLIISGTNIDNYPSDIRKNVFKLEPVNAFKAYDLNTIPGYAVKLYDPQNIEEGIIKRFWRRGEHNPNTISTYSTPDNLLETDDSYYFNEFKYNQVEFSKNAFLGVGGNNYSAINFNSSIGSHIKSPHNDKYNFNDEDFSISFYIRPQHFGKQILNVSASIGLPFAGGIIYSIDDNYVYVIATQAVGRYSNSTNTSYEWGVLAANNNAGVGNVQTGTNSTPKLGDGEQQLVNMRAADSNAPGNLGNFMENFSHNGYTDWYVPTLTEMYVADTNLKILKPNNVSNPKFKNLDKSMLLDGVTNQLLTSTEEIAQSGVPNNFVIYNSGSNLPNTFTSKNLQNPQKPTTFLPIRKIPIGFNGRYDNVQRYIICKSGTQTVSPSNLNPGTQTIKNNATLGSSQPLDTISQPQYPFEIYMISESIYFSRSDGKSTITISSDLIGTPGYIETHHVLCQKSSSIMEIHVDGVLVASGSDLKLDETRNLANLYIGSKGLLSIKDGNNDRPSIGFFNGSLSCINIWNNSFNTASIKNISESIDASPYVGNVFYQNGFVVLTKPTIQDIKVPSLVIQPYDFRGSDTVDQKMQYYSYTQKDTKTALLPRSFDIKPDGSRYYIGNNALYNANGTLNTPPYIYQYNMSSSFDLYSSTSSGDYAPAGIEKTYSVISSSLNALTPNSLFTTSSFPEYHHDITFHPSGTYLYMVGISNTSNTDPSIHGAIWQIPLNTPWDISSGSVVSNHNPAGTASLNTSQAKIYYTPYIKYWSHYDDVIHPNANNGSGQTYRRWGGIDPKTITFKPDGTKCFTYHNHDRVQWDTGDWHNSEWGPSRYQYINPNKTVEASYTILEHTLTTPWDISTIQTTGYFIDSSEGNITQTSSLAFDPLYGGAMSKYNHAGKELGLLNLSSPEGSPIQIKTIEFNKEGTRMYLTSRKSTISMPQGVYYKEGGWGTFGNLNNGWLQNNDIITQFPFLTNSTDGDQYHRQCPRMWEYKLSTPWNIMSAQYVKSKSFSNDVGILEQFTLGIGPFNDRTQLMFNKFADKGRYLYIGCAGNNGLWNIRKLARINLIPPTPENKIQFQGSHLIYEHEYQCTVDEYEFNDTLNISARKIRTQDCHDLADFATGSLFKPYVTTIGLYNEENELLVVGKMGQPIRMSNETDTTFVLRWDI